MNERALAQHLTPPPGVKMAPYPPWRDQTYRVSLAGATVGLLIFGGGLAEGAPDVRLIGSGIVAIATLVASWTFLVWVKTFHQLVLGLAIAGILLLMGVPAIGMGALLAALSVMAAKETHCFHFPTGRVIPWVSLVVGLAGLVPGWTLETGLGYLVVGLLWIPLLVSRFRMPLLAVSGE